MKNKIAEFLDQNVWDGDKVSNSDSLMKVSGHKAYFNPHELHELVCDCLESVTKDKRKGASLNELMEWSVKELVELVIDLIDEENEKVIK